MSKASVIADHARGFQIESRFVAITKSRHAKVGYGRHVVTLGLDVAEKLLKKLEEKKNGVRKSKPAKRPRRKR